MKIKVIPRWEQNMASEGCEEKLYDVYHGFTYFFFFTKWELDRSGLDEKEMKDYLQPFLFGYSPMVIPEIKIEI